MKRSSQIIQIKFFYGDDVIDDVTGGLKCSLYIHV